jgi:hypothetical protein
MKKILLSVSVLMVLASCDGKKNDSTYKLGDTGTTLQLIKMEGCEYFFAPYYKGAIMCHKGNCSNPIHKQQEQ